MMRFYLSSQIALYKLSHSHKAMPVLQTRILSAFWLAFTLT